VVDEALNQAKAALRRDLRQQRRALTDADRTLAHHILAARLQQFLATTPPTALASYLALPEEVDLDALHRWWWSRGHPLWLPKVAGPGLLTWHPVSEPEHLLAGAYGTREPDPAHTPAAPLPTTATVMVPGVGYTRNGHRLGQGGGFYDRLLASHRGPTIGPAYLCQLVDTIPTGPHDRPVDLAIFPD
jgi:5-formyltetrahydrofolate cyclo-ligase